MSFDVSAEAREDVARAIRDSNSRPERNGEALLAEVDAAFAHIAASPRKYATAEDGIPGREIREYFIARFQQRVIYLVNDEDVLVVAVVHASRREGAWHRNVPPAPPQGT